MQRQLNNSSFFSPLKKNYSKEEEQVCEYILWKSSQEDIRLSFLEEQHREPSKREIKLIFDQMINAMKERGLFQKIIDDSRKETVDQENLESEEVEEKQISRPDENLDENMGMQVDPK